MISHFAPAAPTTTATIVARDGSDVPEQSVVDAAIAGGSWAWEVLYAWLAPPLTAYFRSTGAGDDTEDLVSDTFLRMVRAIKGFDGDAMQLRTWVFTIARNLRLDRGRQQSRRGVNAALDSVPEQASRDNVADSVTGMDSLLNLLGQLTDQQHEVMTLRVLGDLTADQIAHALGVKLPKVKSLLRRASERLIALHEQSA